MAGRPRHPKKEVEDAVAYAESRCWTWRKQGHWGRLFCPTAAGMDARLEGSAHLGTPAIMAGRSFVRSIAGSTSRKTKMKMHEFCIIASGLDPKADDLEIRFFEA